MTISMALFYLSFSWLFAERTNTYPFLRRVRILFSEREQFAINLPHFKVMIWGFGYISFWIAMSSVSFCIYSTAGGQQKLLSLLLGPISYFLAPQAISASTTLLILWRVPNDPLFEKVPEGSRAMLGKYRSGNKARNLFVLSLVLSLLLVYGTPILLTICRGPFAPSNTCAAEISELRTYFANWLSLVVLRVRSFALSSL